MKKGYVRLVCVLTAAILATGVCPLLAADWGDYASPKIDSKWFQVDAGSDTYVEVEFGVDSACDLLCQVEGESGSVLGTYNVKNGTVITLSGGGTFYLFVWSNNGACNWTATLGDFGSGGGSVTDPGEKPSVGTEDCNGFVPGPRTTFTAPGYVIVKCSITHDCYPAMSCFTVPEGRVARIANLGIKSGGYNCTTGAYIDDPGLTVSRDCCSSGLFPIYKCGIGKDGEVWDSGSNIFGPGTYTIHGDGGRKFAAEVRFLVK